MSELLNHATVDNDTLLLHPSQIGELKKNILKELFKQKNKWSDELKGVITAVKNVKVLNGGRAMIKDDSAYLHY